MGFERQPQEPAVDYEAILAAEGMAADVRPEEEVLAGDALQTGDRPEARLRDRQIAREEAGERPFDAQYQD